jgi:hypothetical protein
VCSPTMPLRTNLRGQPRQSSLAAYIEKHWRGIGANAFLPRVLCKPIRCLEGLGALVNIGHVRSSRAQRVNNRVQHVNLCNAVSSARVPTETTCVHIRDRWRTASSGTTEIGMLSSSRMARFNAASRTEPSDSSRCSHDGRNDCVLALALLWCAMEC